MEFDPIFLRPNRWLQSPAVWQTAGEHPGHAFVADDYSLLDANQLQWHHLSGHRQITDSYLRGLTVRHQCRFGSSVARLNLHAVPGAQ